VSTRSRSLVSCRTKSGQHLRRSTEYGTSRKFPSRHSHPDWLPTESMQGGMVARQRRTEQIKLEVI
jgi:hypothetical protein